MKVFLFLCFIFSVVGCTSSNKPSKINSYTDKSSERSPFFNDCSMVDTSINEFWILLCQRDPHPQRPELYEYSLLFKTFKRLTYQDGRINEMAVIGIDNIVYSSTYDEAKEKFLEISKGATPGTDLYLRRRTVTDFKRLTKDEGSDHDLFWSKEYKALLFVNSKSKTHTLRKMTLNDKVVDLLKSSSRSLKSPITLSDGTLIWIEWDEERKKSLLMKKGEKAKDVRVMFISASKILSVRPQPGTPNALLAISTGLGTELWSFDFDRECFLPRLQTQLNWARFSMIDTDQIELSVENSDQIRLVRSKLNKAPETCQFSPPSLGIER